MNNWKTCFAGFCMFLGSMVSTLNSDSQPTNENWFSGNTIIIQVNQAK